jgi:hypothetical protein
MAVLCSWSSRRVRVAAGLVLRGAPIHEVPVPYGARRREEGKKLTALGGPRVVRCRLRGG